MKKAVKMSWPVFIFELCIAAAMLIVGYMLWPQLPEMMPSHWNFEGQIDSYMDKSTWIWVFPLITAGLIVLFPLLSRIDPKKEKYVLFRKTWLIVQMVLVSFFAYMYFISLYIALNPEVLITPFIIGGIGVMFVIMGNYLGKVRQNWFLGIRTPWTLDNEEVWNKTHRLGGWMFTISGLVIFAEAFILWQPVFVFIAMLVVTVVFPILYSYFLFQSLEK